MPGSWVIDVHQAVVALQLQLAALGTPLHRDPLRQRVGQPRFRLGSCEKHERRSVDHQNLRPLPS